MLPDNMVTVAASLGIVEKPTKEQMHKLDATYLTYKDREDARNNANRYVNHIDDDE